MEIGRELVRDPPPGGGDGGGRFLIDSSGGGEAGGLGGDVVATAGATARAGVNGHSAGKGEKNQEFRFHGGLEVKCLKVEGLKVWEKKCDSAARGSFSRGWILPLAFPTACGSMTA
jgi:hypothetical protein